MSKDVLFYHMQNTTLENVLPVLLNKLLQRGWRANIRFSMGERMQSFDRHLWQWNDNSFLPHGMETEKFSEKQPILLTLHSHNQNKANVLFIVDAASADAIASFDRIVIIFDGNHEQELEDARILWKKFKSEEHNCTYWQQNYHGRWEQKA